MPSMSLRTNQADILDATEHLPEGATLTIQGLDWDDYEILLKNLAERPNLRVSYDKGRLQIVSISRRHERYAAHVENLIVTACDEFDLTLEECGRTTWRRFMLDRGVEADGSYYIENAKRVLDDREIDLESDPPPDIVLEIDLTTDSRDKFPLYAALAVPEIWRYDGQAIHFHQLRDGEYVEMPGSRALPGLSRELLIESMEISKTQGQTAARKHLRAKLRSS